MEMNSTMKDATKPKQDFPGSAGKGKLPDPVKTSAPSAEFGGGAYSGKGRAKSGGGTFPISDQGKYKGK